MCSFFLADIDVYFLFFKQFYVFYILTVDVCLKQKKIILRSSCRTRSLSNVTFSFLITWRSSSLKSAAVCTKFHENRMILHWDMAIYRFSKWRPSAILELFYHHTRPSTRSLLLAAAACQISCQSDTQIYLNFSHIWLEMPIQAPKMGVLEDFGPLNVIIYHWYPKKAHPCVNPRLLSYQL